MLKSCLWQFKSDPFSYAKSSHIWTSEPNFRRDLRSQKHLSSEAKSSHSSKKKKKVFFISLYKNAQFVFQPGFPLDQNQIILIQFYVSKVYKKSQFVHLTEVIYVTISHQSSGCSIFNFFRSVQESQQNRSSKFIN